MGIGFRELKDWKMTRYVPLFEEKVEERMVDNEIDREDFVNENYCGGGQECRGRPCQFHHPSEHHMLYWPLSNDGLHRVCPKHHRAHVDPDALTHDQHVNNNDLTECACKCHCCHSPKKRGAATRTKNRLRKLRSWKPGEKPPRRK